MTTFLSRHLRTAILLMPALCAILPHAAHADREFSIRFSTNVHGDLVQIGNSIVTCAGTNCAAAQSQGVTGAGQNNNFQMTNIDVDADGTTYNSSTADLTIPAGSTVLFAGLYWTGAQPLPTTQDANYNGTLDTGATCNTCRQVLFGTPTRGYTTVTALQYDTVANTAGTTATIGGTTYYQVGYQGYADVTSLVAAGGSGTYSVANLRTSLYYPNTSWGQFGGWTLVVAYSNGSSTLHNLTVFDGYKFLSSTGSAVTGTISGFLTPPNGAVIAHVGVMAGDGDRGSTGDNININGQSLSDAMNPLSDFFNSTVSRQGVDIPARNPDYTNTLGFDSDDVNVPSGVIPNSSTSATIQITTSGDGYWLGLFTFAAVLYDPNVSATKVATDISPSESSPGDLLVGDVLRWNVNATNTGLDTAINGVAIDNIQDYLTYVPGTIKVGGVAQTDGAGDDLAEYYPANTAGSPCDTGKACVVFRIGNGATNTQGGSLAQNQSTAFQLDTVVNGGSNTTLTCANSNGDACGNGNANPGRTLPPPPAGTKLSNSVTLIYNGQTLGTTVAASTATAAAAATSAGPPLVTKSFSPSVIDQGQLATLTITVTNPSGNPALTGVGFTDTYPTGIVNAAVPNALLNCTSGANNTSANLTGGTAGGNSIGITNAVLPANGVCTITVNVTSDEAFNNYTNTIHSITATTPSNATVTNATGTDVASATFSVGRPKITKAFSPTTIAADSATAHTSATLTFTISNVATVPLHSAAFTDPLPTGMVVATTPSVSNGCGSGTVSAAAGASSISVSGMTLAAASNATTPSTCTISVNVTSPTGGVYDNQSNGVSSTESGAAGLSSNIATLTVVGPPTVTQSFYPVSVQKSTTTASYPSTLTITISNPNTTTTITNAAFTDTYPSGLVNSSPSGVALACTSGSSAALTGSAAGGNTVGISGGVLAPGGSCTVTINVQSTTGTMTLPSNLVNPAITVTTSNAGSGASATATLNVTNLTAPVVVKAFSAATIASGGTTTLSITLTNSNATSITGVGFTDVFPPNLIITALSTNTCGGTVQGSTDGTNWHTVASGDTQLRLSGGTISARVGATNGSCAVSTSVTSSVSAAYTNNIGTIVTDNAGTFGGNSAICSTGSTCSASLSVLAPPTVSKSFDSNTVATNTNTTLAITITNPNQVALTNVILVDPFPNEVTNCNGTNNCVPIRLQSTTITYSPANCATVQGRRGSNNAFGTLQQYDTALRVTIATLAAGASCTISATLRSTATGNYTNITNAVTATGPVALTGNVATDTLSVSQPYLTKAFTCAQPIAANTACAMTLTLTNPVTGNTNDLAGGTFVDVFPGEAASDGTMTLANATVTNNGCGGTIVGRTGSSGSWGTPAAGNTALRLTGGALQNATGANTPRTCTITVNVQSTQTATNTIPAGSAAPCPTPANGVPTASCGLTGTMNGNAVSSGADTSATLQIYQPPQVQKSFSVSSILAGGTTTMTLHFTNLNSVAASGFSFTDVFPTTPGQMKVAATPNTNNTCGGTLQGSTVGGTNNANWHTVAANDTYLRIGTSTGTQTGTINANGYCEVKVDVTASATGAYTNTIAAGNVTTTNIGSSASDASDTLTVVGPLTIAKAFSPNQIQVNETSLLSITLTNPNATVAVTGITMTDAYPSGVTNTATPNVANSCNGTVTAAQSGNSLALAGGTIPAGGTCVITVQVTSATASPSGSPYTNTIASNAVTTTNAGTAPTANVSATLTVTAPSPNLSMLKMVQVVSDPVNGATLPKAIPGAVMQYTIQVTNSGLGTVDNNTVVVSDTALPSQVELCVSTLCAPSGPFVFIDSSPTSGLTCVFVALNNGSDCVDFTSDGTTWTYTPTADANGYDASVKGVRFRPAGTMNGAGASTTSGQFTFRVKIK